MDYKNKIVKLNNLFLISKTDINLILKASLISLKLTLNLFN